MKNDEIYFDWGMDKVSFFIFLVLSGLRICIDVGDSLGKLLIIFVDYF